MSITWPYYGPKVKLGDVLVRDVDYLMNPFFVRHYGIVIEIRSDGYPKRMVDFGTTGGNWKGDAFIRNITFAEFMGSKRDYAKVLYEDYEVREPTEVVRLALEKVGTRHGQWTIVYNCRYFAEEVKLKPEYNNEYYGNEIRKAIFMMILYIFIIIIVIIISIIVIRNYKP